MTRGVFVSWKPGLCAAPRPRPWGPRRPPHQAPVPESSLRSAGSGARLFMLPECHPCQPDPSPSPSLLPRHPFCKFMPKVGHRGAGSLSPAGVTRSASLFQVRGRRLGTRQLCRHVLRPAFAAHPEQTPRGPFNPGCSPRGQGAGPGSWGWWRRLWTPWVPVALTAARCDRICRPGWTPLTSTALSWCPSEPESSTCRRTSPPSWPGRWGGCPRR